MNYINCLLVSIGKGELVDEAGSADYVLPKCEIITKYAESELYFITF